MAMNVDKLIDELDDLDAFGLARLINAAEEKRASKLHEARAAFIAETKEKAAALGVRLEELAAPTARKPGGGRGRKRGSVAAQYRGPQGEEWTGRGRSPRWLAALEAQGHTREQYRIAAAREKGRDLLSDDERESVSAA